MNLELQNSIEDLYRVFAKYPLKPRIGGCSCCATDEVNRDLHSKPLRELPSDVLSIYGFKAMTTIGDAEDFRHFLPRLFEILVLDEFGYNEETLFRKLDYAGWQNWDHEERATIEDFFVALFRTAV